MPQPVMQAPTTCSQSRSLRFDVQSPMAWPNYISQYEDKQLPHMQPTTRSASYSIMQEAMLSCVDIYKPELCCNSAQGHTVHGYTATNVSTQDPNYLVLKNGKFSTRRQWRTLGILPPHHKLGHTGNLDTLLWKQDQAPCLRDARSQLRPQHHCLHQEVTGPSEQSQRRDLWPHHLPHPT